MVKLVGCLFAAFVAAGGSGIAQGADLTFPGSEAGAPAGLPPLPELTIDAIDLGALRDRALAVADAFPAADYDVDALAARLQGDPLAAFAYVRDLGLDPYDGVLRGPAGVLGAGAGSSADKSTLLVALLERMGVTARYAFGSLDAAALAAITARAVEAPRPGDAEVAVLAGLSSAALERLAARAGRDFAWLWAAVGDRLTPAAELQPAPRHIWVQALIDGMWIDLDPSLPTNQPGDVIATGATTAEALPSRLEHLVLLTVVAETVVDGALETAVVLEQELAAADASQRHIFLSFAPEGGGAGLMGSAIIGSLGGSTGHVPVLTVGDDVFQGTVLPSLATSGASDDSPFGGDAADFFFGGEEATPGGPDLAALYLDVAVISPWAEPVIRRRILMDRIDPRARRTGSVDVSSLAPVASIGSLPEAYATIHQIAISTGGANPHQTAVGMALAAEFIGARMGTPEALAELSLPEMLWPVGAINAGFVLATEALTVAALNDREGLRFHVGAPRVFVLSFQPVETAGGTELSFAIDLLHDTVVAVGAPDVPAAEVALRRMWYGSLQSALETTLAELRVAGLVGDGRHVVSTSTEMLPSLSVMSSVDGMDGQLPAALAAALADDDLVVANAGMVSPQLETWWTVDPVDGTTRAVWAPGLGGSGGGGYRPGSNYTNASVGGDRLIVDERTGREIGRVRNGRDYYYRQGARGGTCRGGNEYSTILGCVSLPAGMALGTAYALVIGEIVFFAAVVIYAAT